MFANLIFDLLGVEITLSKETGGWHVEEREGFWWITFYVYEVWQLRLLAVSAIVMGGIRQILNIVCDYQFLLLLLFSLLRQRRS